MDASSLSTTSYAILGYLAIRPWTAYELTKQLGRTFHHFWPRAESGIYREMKRLDQAGLASSTEERSGGRNRTLYEITDAGRGALRSWLAEPGSDGFLESEALVRVLFADRGDRATLQALLDAMRRDVEERSDQMQTLMQDYLVTGGQFPQRSHINVLIARFIIDFSTMVREWTAWSSEFIATWPDVAEHQPDERTLQRIRETIAAATRDG